MRNIKEELEAIGFTFNTIDLSDSRLSYHYKSISGDFEIEVHQQIDIKPTKKIGILNFHLGTIMEASIKENGLWSDLEMSRLNINQIAKIISTKDPNSPLYERELARNF